MNRTKLEAQLTRQEDRRTRPYLDTVGKITWGVGRNVSDRDWSPDELVLVNQLIDLCLANDITIADTLSRAYPWYASLSDARQNVVANLMFNMGPNTFAQFHHFHTAMAAGDWPAAAQSLRDSKWHGQVGHRAVELEQQLLDDALP